MTHLPYIMSTVRTAAEHIGGALYDLGVNDRDSALRRLYRAKAALEDAIGRMPGQQDEILRRLDRVTGYVEGLQIKLRTAEAAAIKPTDVRSIEVNSIKIEAPEKPL